MKLARSRRNRKKYIIITIICLFITITLALTINYLYKKVVNKYEVVIDNYEKHIADNTKTIFVAREDIKYSTMLSSYLIEEKEIETSIDSKYFMDEGDIDKILLTDVSKDTPLMKNMLTLEEIPDDIREQEYNMFMLQGNLSDRDYIDVRIGFPNGEDFIVTSKKKLHKIYLDTNTVLVWLNEQEILTLNCALVDAYLNKGTKLYVTKYVQPELQADAVVTYPIRLEVLELIRNNPNILDKAESELSEQARIALDERLNELSEEVIDSVSNGISEDLSKRSSNIENISEEENIRLEQEELQEQQQEQQEQEEEEIRGSDRDDYFN